MVVYDGEILRPIMPADFPDHPFSALVQVEQKVLHAIISGTEVAPHTYSVELPKSDPRTIGRLGMVHINQFEFGDVAIWELD